MTHGCCWCRGWPAACHFCTLPTSSSNTALSLQADAAELKTLMGLGNKEAAEMEADVKQAAYK